MLEFYPDLEEYFPIYKAGYILTRKFFWEVFGSLHHDEAKSFIAQEREARYLKEEQEKEKVIHVDPKILKALEVVNYFGKKKGRALFKINTKAYPSLINKRKHQYRSDMMHESPFKKRKEELMSDGRMNMSQHGDSGDKTIKIYRRRQPANNSHEIRTPSEKRKGLFNMSQEQIGLSADK